jgi:ketosteroid isomerase-like protein
MNRLEIDGLLRKLYAARLRGDLDAVCQSFSDNAVFQIGGAGQNATVSNKAIGVEQFRPLLAVMIRSFKLSDQTILSILIDGVNAAVHWRAKVYSLLTGTAVLTELVDLIEVRDAASCPTSNSSCRSPDVIR